MVKLHAEDHPPVPPELEADTRHQYEVPELRGPATKNVSAIVESSIAMEENCAFWET